MAKLTERLGLWRHRLPEMAAGLWDWLLRAGHRDPARSVGLLRRLIGRCRREGARARRQTAGRPCRPARRSARPRHGRVVAANGRELSRPGFKGPYPRGGCRRGHTASRRKSRQAQKGCADRPRRGAARRQTLAPCPAAPTGRAPDRSRTHSPPSKHRQSRRPVRSLSRRRAGGGGVAPEHKGGSGARDPEGNHDDPLICGRTRTRRHLFARHQPHYRRSRERRAALAQTVEHRQRRGPDHTSRCVATASPTRASTS